MEVIGINTKSYLNDIKKGALIGSLAGVPFIASGVKDIFKVTLSKNAKKYANAEAIHQKTVDQFNTMFHKLPFNKETISKVRDIVNKEKAIQVISKQIKQIKKLILDSSKQTIKGGLIISACGAIIGGSCVALYNYLNNKNNQNK